ncbi:hypothetical protein HanIR_Chr08g0344461 [Helianthus annuus]|nr:hypothetical protein HanIR_Chr08g0344461 [Helianthus annuus]
MKVLFCMVKSLHVSKFNKKAPFLHMTKSLNFIKGAILSFKVYRINHTKIRFTDLC